MDMRIRFSREVTDIAFLKQVLIRFWYKVIVSVCSRFSFHVGLFLKHICSCSLNYFTWIVKQIFTTPDVFEPTFMSRLFIKHTRT